MTRAGVDGDAVAARYERTLALLIPPQEQGVVRTFFSTETAPVAIRPRPILVDKPVAEGVPR